jgi:hypothetical protein
MQPAPDKVALPDSRRFTDQDQESCLKGILGVLRIAKDSAANAHYHRSMPSEEGLKGCFVTAIEECLQQLPIGPVSLACREEILRR